MENFKRTRRLLEELQDEKEKMEQHLYGLFLPILHSKQVGSGSNPIKLFQLLC